MWSVLSHGVFDTHTAKLYNLLIKVSFAPFFGVHTLWGNSNCFLLLFVTFYTTVLFLCEYFLRWLLLCLSLSLFSHTHTLSRTHCVFLWWWCFMPERHLNSLCVVKVSWLFDSLATLILSFFVYRVLFATARNFCIFPCNDIQKDYHRMKEKIIFDYNNSWYQNFISIFRLTVNFLVTSNFYLVIIKIM